MTEIHLSTRMLIPLAAKIESQNVLGFQKVLKTYELNPFALSVSFVPKYTDIFYKNIMSKQSF
jgi:hypothetical protein